MTRMRRAKALVVTLAATVALLTAMVAPATAITNGQLDGDGHPHVGLMVAYVGGVPQWRCSGTLVSPTVYLTAGHCTFGADHVEIWFDSSEDVIRAKGYPFLGGDSVGGTPYAHPDYDDNAFFLRDVGVVVLDEPQVRSTYGTLPALDSLDQLKTRRGTQVTWFRAVGYGLQYVNPVFIEQDLDRRVSYPKLNQINVPGFTGDFSLLLSNNAATGGTCSGDSGGPNFLGNTQIVAAVTSFGINNCTGVGGVFRMDRAWALDFVNGFLD